MNSRIIGAAIGVLMLGGTTLASANGLDDLFRLLSHPEQRVDHREDQEHYARWHREYRGFPDREERRWERHHSYNAPRFEAHGGYDRGGHSGFGWNRHDRDGH